MGFLVGTSLSAIAFGLLLWGYGGHGLMIAARSDQLAQSVPPDAFRHAFGGVLIGSAVVTAGALAVAWRFPNHPEHQ
jgi:hypothetical protein